MADPLTLVANDTATPTTSWAGCVIRTTMATAVYTLLWGVLVLATALTSVTAANMLPGIIPFDGTRADVIFGSALIVQMVGTAFFFEVHGGGPRIAFRTLTRRSRHLIGLLGLRRSAHQTLTALWLGLAGGALSYGLESLVMATVTFPPSTQPDTRAAAIAHVAPVIGGAFYAIHAALYEEIIYRGLLLLAVAAVARLWSNRRAQLIATLILLIVTSTAFGYSHLSWSTANAVTAGLSGIIFGALALHQRSIWPAVIAHATMNFVIGLTTVSLLT